MKVSNIIRTIKTNPELWTVKYNNNIVMAFEYNGFTFGKLTNQVETYSGQIKLVNKKLGIEMVWKGDDAVGSQLWSSVVMHYVNTQIISK